MRICFSADSLCDMNSEFLERYPVRVIPLRVEMDGEYYVDGVDIGPDEIISRVHRGSELPKTAAVNVQEYRSAFEDMLREADAVLHFNIGSSFSSCWQNACVAAEGLPVYPIDSASLSCGIALLIVEAAERAHSGMDAPQIARELMELRGKLDVSFMVDRLDFLYKGGRCSSVALLGANALHLRPCIEVSEGSMGVGRKYRGSYKRCVTQYLAERMADKAQISEKCAFLVHTGVSEEALTALREIISDEMHFSELYTVRAGGSITSHCGENAVSLMMLRK